MNLKINRYLKIALLHRASDLHFSSGEPVRLRVDGDLVPLEEGAISSEILRDLLFELLTEEERAKFEKNRNLDKSYTLEGVGNFRVNIFQTRRGFAAVIRTIPHKIPTIEQLGLPANLTKLTEAGKGLVLVTGPTGSGKSTTLAALIHHINQNNAYHILTAEDPIEFVHESIHSLINQREIGSQCPTFADALKYALREDPDVILVGEMRDLETIALALTAAETGHLVFGTLHTRGAAASVDRIIDSFPSNQQAMIRTMLAESLTAVISQGLLKKADGTGRVAAYEILVVNHATSNLIREGKTFQIPTIMQTGRKEGMILMDQSILELTQKGIVTGEEASAYMANPELLGVAYKRKTTQPTPQGNAQELSKPVFKSIPTTEALQKTPVPTVQKSVSSPIQKNAPPSPGSPSLPMKTLQIDRVDASQEFLEVEPTDVTNLSELVSSDPDETALPERRIEEDAKETMIMELPRKPTTPVPTQTPQSAPPPPFPKRKTG